jgi:F-type H+-transporting ATPase subunit b
MSLFATTQVAAAQLLGALPAADEPLPNDGVGTTSINPIFAPFKEVLWGGIATLTVFAVLYKFAWPAIAQAMRDRTQRIQDDLDTSAAARAKAEQDATEIRSALGDIDAERQRLFAEADAEAEALLASGRARLEQELADVEARADADLATTATRGTDDLRADIARFSSAAIEDTVAATLDDAAQQDLIETFIARVGAGR